VEQCTKASSVVNYDVVDNFLVVRLTKTVTILDV